jgi:DNA-binding NarL/FixJ family response regulator
LAAAGAALAVVAGLTAIDVTIDLGGGTSVGHVLIEGVVVVIGAAAAALVWRRVLALGARARAAERTTAALTRDVADARADADRWRREAAEVTRGVAEAIERQFAAWQLTPVEAEVARLLLKGLSHKEIAAVRDSTEATARQHAAAVYRKAGLAGRAELAAFFLEDLLAPVPTSGTPA